MSAEPAPAPVVASTETKEEPNELEQKVLGQVEYYFGNSNLPKDKFLNQQLLKNNGWVPIQVIASFKRMQVITKDLSTVVNALKKSKSLLQVSEDGTKVRRATPVPPPTDALPRTIYAKGFPEAGTTIESVRLLFADIAPVSSIVLRRTRDAAKKFKGSVFIEFETEEDAKKAAEAKITVPGQAEPLQILSQSAYYAQKKAECEAKGIPWAEHKPKRGAVGGAAGAEGAEAGADGEGEGEKVSKSTRKRLRQEAAAEEMRVKKDSDVKKFTRDRIVKLEGLPAEAKRDDIKTSFTEAGFNVQYVDWNDESKFALVRLASDGKSASEAVAHFADKQVAGHSATLSALGGQSELEYIEKVVEGQLQKKKKMQSKGGRQNKRQRKN